MIKRSTFKKIHSFLKNLLLTKTILFLIAYKNLITKKGTLEFGHILCKFKKLLNQTVRNSKPSKNQTGRRNKQKQIKEIGQAART